MSTPAGPLDILTELCPRSSVRLETNAKGGVQAKVSVYAGESEAEMERLMMLAIKVHRDIEANLGGRVPAG